MPVQTSRRPAPTDGPRRTRAVAGSRAEASSPLILAMAAALLAMVAIYGTHLLARHARLPDHTGKFTAALLLTDTAGALENLRTAAAGVTAADAPAGQFEFQRRLHAASARVGLLSSDVVTAALPTDGPLTRLAQDLRQAIDRAEAFVRGDTDIAAVAALAETLRQAAPAMVRIAADVHGDAQSRNAEQIHVLRRDHVLLTGLLSALVACGLLLMVLLARHKRLLSSANQEVDILVADLRRTGSDLRIQNDRFEAALTNMSQALCVVDSDQSVVVCNARLHDLFGVTEADTRPGTPIARLFAAIPDGKWLDRTMVRAIQSRQRDLISAGRSGGFTHEAPDGRAVAVSHQPMPGGGWVATYENVTDRRQAEARIRFLAYHDCLTGLPNRAALIERLIAALHHGRRHTEQLAVLTINLDHFRTVNDLIGHDAGDLLLKAVAQRLRNIVRDADFVARTGNDEFVVLQRSAQQPAEAEVLARRIVDVLAAPYEIDHHRARITASIGIAIAAAHETDPDVLLTHADTSLDRAKAEGRDTYRFFDPEVDARVQVRRMMEYDLREAMTRGDFILLYQPIWDLHANRVSGFEALLRWVHPERGMVPPTEFIPLAEELGLIGTIGTWVIGQACQDAAKWPEGFSVSVNLSAVQFQGDGLDTVVDQALAHAGLDPHRLILEITESVLLHDDPRIVETLHGLRRCGIRIALDDFGTGYSSLSYLVSFPFDELKIDQSFVRDMTTRRECRAIVQSVVALASQLGIATTAEGVETEAQLALIRAAGCAYAQGYYFSKAEPVTGIARWFTLVREDGVNEPLG